MPRLSLATQEVVIMTTYGVTYDDRVGIMNLGFQLFFSGNMDVCLEWVFIHDDVIKWKHFPRYWPFVRGIHRSPVNSPHKGLWRGALMFSLICARSNGWVNNGEAGDLRRHRAHYDVTVMSFPFHCFQSVPLATATRSSKKTVKLGRVGRILTSTENGAALITIFAYNVVILVAYNLFKHGGHVTGRWNDAADIGPLVQTSGQHYYDVLWY